MSGNKSRFHKQPHQLWGRALVQRVLALGPVHVNQRPDTKKDLRLCWDNSVKSTKQNPAHVALPARGSGSLPGSCECFLFWEQLSCVLAPHPVPQPQRTTDRNFSRMIHKCQPGRKEGIFSQNPAEDPHQNDPASWSGEIQDPGNPNHRHPWHFLWTHCAPSPVQSLMLNPLNPHNSPVLCWGNWKADKLSFQGHIASELQNWDLKRSQEAQILCAFYSPQRLGELEIAWQGEKRKGAQSKMGTVS